MIVLTQKKYTVKIQYYDYNKKLINPPEFKTQDQHYDDLDVGDFITIWYHRDDTKEYERENPKKIFNTVLAILFCVIGLGFVLYIVNLLYTRYFQ